MRASLLRSGVRLCAVVVTGTLFAGCHHVIIDGGLEPTGTAHDEEWNLAFAAAIFPAKVDASGYCGGYYSGVETRHSFLNVVVTGFTFGIISPMETRIRCGSPGGGEDDVQSVDGADDIEPPVDGGHGSTAGSVGPTVDGGNQGGGR